jgi:hypothetical protein
MRAATKVIGQRDQAPLLFVVLFLVTLGLLFLLSLELVNLAGATGAPDEHLMAPFRWQSANNLA